MKLLDRISDKPQYVLHPVRLARRALHSVRGGTGNRTTVTTLPWGLPLMVDSGEAIGYTILTAGVFDPAVTESLYRLIDPGDLVVDVGANVGYVTSLAAARAGEAGRVLAYEPHPQVFAMLEQNARRWQGRQGTAAVETTQGAVSDRTGTAELSFSSMFHVNMGLATLSAEQAPPGLRSEVVEVQVQRLDDVLDGCEVGVLKIDVEGHEEAVLAGARELLRAGKIRDLVFEDHESYPDACTEIVESAGYTLLSLQNDLFGLRLVEPAQRGPKPAWPGPSYLATRDPARARARLERRGWQVPGIAPTPPWALLRRFGRS
ncbi:MAG: FkbM family methyltransferase [Solirubrobacteraceae bacterium]